MGAILDRQNETDYSGLQIFAGASAVLGAGMLAASTYALARERKTWRI